MKNYSNKEWNKAYSKGTSWDTETPSKNIIQFRNYLKSGDIVLDLGCGSGRDVIYLSKEGFETYGIDFSKVAIEKTKKKYQNKKLHLSINNLEFLPFKNEFFDRIYCGFVLEKSNLKKSINEIHRVLKKEGIFYLVIALNSKFLKTGSIKQVIKEKIVKNATKNFNIIKKERYFVKNIETKNQRKSEVLVLILQKQNHY